jgi:hypothetical protein
VLFMEGQVGRASAEAILLGPERRKGTNVQEP